MRFSLTSPDQPAVQLGTIRQRVRQPTAIVAGWESGTVYKAKSVATHCPNVPETTKRALREQAGRKCANPGCPAGRTHIHHIREWAVYQTHDSRHMIAICPNCHDAVHHGALEISDQTLYRWKEITRTDAAKRGHLYVEPGREAKLVLGSIAVTGDAGLLVFELSRGNHLSFALKDGDVVLLSLAVTDRHGRVLARLVDGHVKIEIERTVREPLRG